MKYLLYVNDRSEGHIGPSRALRKEYLQAHRIADGLILLQNCKNPPRDVTAVKRVSVSDILVLAISRVKRTRTIATYHSMFSACDRLTDVRSLL